MEKLQSYFDYFDKYSDVKNWKWYKDLESGLSIAKKIKITVGLDGDIREKSLEEINELISKSSNQEIKNIGDFFEKFLFTQDNGIGNISQGSIWDTNENPHKREIKNEISKDFFLNLLLENDIKTADGIIHAVVNTKGRDYDAAKIRLLRVLFPEKIAAVDASPKLERLLKSIESKLGFALNGSALEKHQSLMNSVQDDDISKKQIFFWVLFSLLENNLDLKKAIVYYGAPGTGKTYKAEKVAKKYIDQHRIKIGKAIGNDYKIDTVQFHPSYSYEDFIEGIRPAIGGSLKLSNGTFKAFCKKVGKKEIELYRDKDFINNESFKNRDYKFALIAVSELNDSQKHIIGVTGKYPDGITIEEVIEPAFFIIDEINRAELSRVFGELMYSLEYRGYKGRIKTQYSYLNQDEKDESVYFWVDSEDTFFIPQNVFIIGTMNTIDRSVDSFDFALRRRFMWEEIHPNFNIVRNHLKAGWSDKLATAFEKLNKKIELEELLGKDYRIGHSYALAIEPIQNRFDTLKDVKDFLWKDFVRPLLQEYLRGLGVDSKAQEKLKEFEKEFCIS